MAEGEGKMKPLLIALIAIAAFSVNAASHAQPVPAGQPREPLLREMCERRAVSAPMRDDKGIKEAREALRTTFINSCMIVERLSFETLEQMRTTVPKEIFDQCLQEGASYSGALKCVQPHFGYSPPSKSE
jgi:hypothetical protein